MRSGAGHEGAGAKPARRKDGSKAAQRHHQMLVPELAPVIRALQQTHLWADRAVIALLYRLIPKVCRVRLRLIVSPDTVLRSLMDLA